MIFSFSLRKFSATAPKLLALGCLLLGSQGPLAAQACSNTVFKAENYFFKSTQGADNRVGTSKIQYQSTTSASDRQTVEYAVRFSDDAKPGKYYLNFYYTSWPLGGTRPVSPTLCVTKEVTLLDPPFRYPLESSVTAYDLPLRAGYQSELTEATAVAQAPDCSTAEPGSSAFINDGVNAVFALGRRSGNWNAGLLQIKSADVSSFLYNPASLFFLGMDQSDVRVVKRGNILRQIRAPQAVADIVVTSTTAYEIRFYLPAQAGAPDTTGLSPLTGSPFVSYVVTNPDTAQTKRLQITEVRGAERKVTIYTYDQAQSLMTLSTGNGLRNETVATAADSTARKVLTRTVKDINQQVVSVAREVVQTFPWGEAVVSEVKDPANAALTTTSVYYTDPNDTANFGRLAQRQEANGSWEKFTYDTQGRLLKRVHPLLNSALGAPEGQSRVLLKSYITIPDQDGDGLPERMETTLENSAQGESHRVFTITYSKLDLQPQGAVETSKLIECTQRGANWNDPSNLVTTMRVFRGGDLDSRPVSTLVPEGSLTTYTYTSDSTTFTTTVLTGQASSDRTTVVKGTKTVTVETLLGQPVSTQTVDYPSLAVLTSSVVTAKDSFGRATRIEHPDGTFETMAYACCGLAAVTDRSGTATQISYNALGYTEQVTQAGVTVQTLFDPENRPLAVTQRGTDGSVIATTTNQYDLAGRLIAARDALNRLTSYYESVDSIGQTVTTTVYPDGGVRTEVNAKDGTPISITGSAVQQPVRFEYGSDQEGAFTKEIFLGDSGETTEWTKTYYDVALRPYKIVSPDGTARQLFYNNLGKLAKEIDPDGVTTLYTYDEQGEEEYKVVDMNRNGQIDFTGEDRITRVVRDVVVSHNVTVARETTSVWDQPGVDHARVLAVKETTLDGSQSWETTLGLTTTKSISVNAQGKIEKTTFPDGTTETKTYQNDLLTFVVHAVPSGPLSTITHQYDSQGRLAASTDSRKGTTSYTYYNDGKVRSVTSPDPDPSRTGPGFDPLTITYEYDAAGRQNKVVHPDGSFTQTQYYPTGLVQKTWGSNTYPVSYTYSSQGQLKTMTTWQNYAGNTGAAITTWTYDPARGFLTGKTYADGQGLRLAYTAAGRLATRTWARGVASSYTYNNAGEIISTVYSDGTPSVTATYDREGRPWTVTDASGKLTRTYDNRADGIATEAYGSSGLLAGVVVQHGFDPLSRPNRVTASVGSTSLVQTDYGYDLASRLATVTNGDKTATYAYLADTSMVASVTFQRGSVNRLVVTKTYDKLDHLTSIEAVPSAGARARFAYDYNALEKRQKLTREDSAQWNYNYDSKGQLTRARKSLPSGTAALGYDFTYAYDDIGNRVSASVNSHASSATVNSVNEVTQRTVPRSIEVTGTAHPSATVTVDGVTAQRQDNAYYYSPTIPGNAAYYSDMYVGAKIDGLPYVYSEKRSVFLPATPELFRYDADGNLLSDGQWQYTWDAENRLIAIQTLPTLLAPGGPLPVSEYKRLEFSYDSQSRRIRKTVLAWTNGAWTKVSDRRFVYDGWNLLTDYDPARLIDARSYTWGVSASGDLHDGGGIGGLLMVTTPTDSNFTTYDGNGNVVALVDSSTGEFAAEYEYDPFGNLLRISSQAGLSNPFRFSTKYTDDETGLIYYGFRYYSSTTGRWLGRDPLEEQGGSNVFGFVNNDPLNQIDPYGLSLGSWANDKVRWVFRHVKTYRVFRVAYTGGFKVPRLAKLKYKIGIYGRYGNDRTSQVSGFGYLYAEAITPIVFFGVKFDVGVQPQLGFSGVIWCNPKAKSGWRFYDSPSKQYCGGYFAVNVGAKFFIRKTVGPRWARIEVEGGGFVGGRYSWPQNHFKVSGYVYISATEKLGSWEAKQEARIGTSVEL